MWQRQRPIGTKYFVEGMMRGKIESRRDETYDGTSANFETPLEIEFLK